MLATFIVFSFIELTNMGQNETKKNSSSLVEFLKPELHQSGGSLVQLRVFKNSTSEKVREQRQDRPQSKKTEARGKIRDRVCHHGPKRLATVPPPITDSHYTEQAILIAMIIQEVIRAFSSIPCTRRR
jgi:hypothetical protein